MPHNVNERLSPHHTHHSQIIRSPVRVWAAVWCSSVGSTWTLELRELDDNTPLGRVRDWISSGVPISQPEPTALAYQLLAARGLRLYHLIHWLGYPQPTFPWLRPRRHHTAQLAKCGLSLRNLS